MHDIAVIRGVSLMLPLLLSVVVVYWKRPNHRERGALLLVFLWNVVFLLAVNVLAQAVGWWNFDVTESVFSGVPVDLLLGWALLWGPLSLMLSTRVALVLVVGILAWLDFLLMPLMEPVLRLGDQWFIGEGVALVVVLIPAHLLGRLTIANRNLHLRVWLQACLFAGLSFYVLPSIILESTGTSWTQVFKGFSTTIMFALLQIAVVPAAIALTSVVEFVRIGKGTPFPWDPPSRLVTSGPCAYVANPMQLSMTFLILLFAIAISSWWMVVATFGAVAFSAGIAAWNEHQHLGERFGDKWRVYRNDVKDWLPKWRPTIQRPEGTLYVALSCGPCSTVWSWFDGKNGVNLRLSPAENHPQALRRIRYENGDVKADGIKAVAHAFEHVHLGWACTGWVMRLPVITTIIQVVTDAVGGGPRDIKRSVDGDVDSCRRSEL